MTHEYTILIGGLVLPGDGRPACTAIAWAIDTVLALGSDPDVLAISRGDSLVVELNGRVVVPLAEGEALEVGGAANLAVLAAGARAGVGAVVARFQRGLVTEGALPGLDHDAVNDGGRQRGQGPGA